MHAQNMYTMRMHRQLCRTATFNEPRFLDISGDIYRLGLQGMTAKILMGMLCSSQA